VLPSLIEGDDLLQGELGIAGQVTCVLQVQHLAGQSQLDPVGGQVVVGHREEALALELEDLADAAACRVDHLDVEHGRCQELVSVMLLRGVFHDNALHAARNEASQVGEYELIVQFNHVDAPAQGVVLVGDAVVQGLADGVGLVLVHLLGKEGSFLEVAVLEVADPAIDLIHCQKQRRAHDPVILVLTLVVLEKPPDLGVGRS